MTGAAQALPQLAPGRVVVAVLLLTAALLVLGGRPGGERLRVLLEAAPGAVPGAAPGGATPLLRAEWAVVGTVAATALAGTVGGVAAGVVAALACIAAGVVLARRTAAGAGPDGDPGSGDLAGGWELLAVCLEAGLPVATAVSAAAGPLGGPTGAGLRRVSGLLELGADPAQAWGTVQEVAALAAFARAAGRSAGTGAALARVARAEGQRLRAELLDSAQARAQRAAVLITGPLGLCFLPAFLVLGIAPVVLGLAGEALARW